MEESIKVVVFKVGKEEYAVQIKYVISIEKLDHITPIPHLPEYVRGIMKVRGELIPVLDLEEILYNRLIQDFESSRIIVLQLDDLSIGVLVNEAKDIIDISSEQIKHLGLVAYKKTNYFTGVAMIDSRMITLINPALLVHSLEGIREIQEFMNNNIPG